MFSQPSRCCNFHTFFIFLWNHLLSFSHALCKFRDRFLCNSLHYLLSNFDRTALYLLSRLRGFQSFTSPCNKIIMMLHEIMVTQCTDRSQHALVSDGTNSVVRRIWQQYSLCRERSWVSWYSYPEGLLENAFCISSVLDIIIGFRVRVTERLVFIVFHPDHVPYFRS
jgi:hypothetical protein